MNVIKYIIIGLLAIFSSYIQLLAYNRISDNSIVFNKKIIISSIVSGILITINSYINENITRVIISYIVITIAALLVFDDKLDRCFLNMLLCYIIMLIFELLSSVLFMTFNIVDIDKFDNSIFFKVSYSIINMFFIYCISGCGFTKKIAEKINKLFGKSSIIFMLCMVTFIVLTLLDFKMTVIGNKRVYITNIFILLSFGFVILYAVYNNIKSLKEVEKTETLLNFISTYEKKIDEDRINRHEMLNNLLILKSFKNKNSKEFNDTLDDLIKIYDKKGTGVKNINKLPGGLKGMVYYKLEEVQRKELNVNINISKQVSLSLEKLNHKDYVLLCKAMGIVLDNAIEASNNSRDKFLNLDIYKENENVIIMVDNTFNKKVDLDKLGTKNYSTKGEGRGLGLYIIKNLLKTSKYVVLEQSINNNIFSSKIIVKQN